MDARPFARRWSKRLSILYLVAVAAGGVWYALGADDRALTMLFLYGPRCVAALPMIPLVPLALLGRSAWGSALLAATALGLAGPWMGGRLSYSGLTGDSGSGSRYRVVTWNAGGGSPAQTFKTWLVESGADIVAVQESPDTLSPADFPAEWHVRDGNGRLRLASKYPTRFLESIGTGELPLPGAAARFRLETPDGPLTVCNVHLSTPREGIQTALASKFTNLTDLRTTMDLQARSSHAVRAWVGEPAGLTLIAGDFNMPVETRLYRRDWGHLQNAFSEAGNGWGGTKMTSWHRIRIDHILFAPPFRARRCTVGPDLGSDHLPTVADLAIEGNP